MASGPNGLFFPNPGNGDFGWTLDATIVTPVSFGTVTLESYFKKRIGDTLYVRGTWKNGTVAAATAALNIGSGLVIDSAKLTTTANAQHVGLFYQVRTAAGPATNGPPFVIHYDGTDTDTLFLTFQSGSNAFTKVNASSMVNTSDSISFEFNVPIVGWS